MINFLKFKRVIEKALKEELSSSELNDRLGQFEPNTQIIKFLSEKFRKFSCEKVTPVELRVLNRCVYSFKHMTLGQELTVLLNTLKDYTDDDLWDILSEIEFSFTVLGILGYDDSLDILEYFSERKLYWDDTFNFNISAIRAIANIGTDKSIDRLKVIAKRSEDELRFESVRLLEKLKNE